jgi:ABC-type uncharacterized transport system ATPase subunit
MKNFVKKYQPEKLSEMVFHNMDGQLVKLFEKTAKGQIAKNILLFGPNGTGKTRLAKILTSSFYANFGEPDITDFVMMASQTDNSRYRYDRITFQWSKSGICWHILDEVEKCRVKYLYEDLHDTLTNEHGHKYILTSNSITDIHKGIKSRAIEIFIDCPTPEEFLPRAKFILEQEGITASDDKILSVMRAYGNDIRKYLTALELL